MVFESATQIFPLVHHLQNSQSLLSTAVRATRVMKTWPQPMTTAKKIESPPQYASWHYRRKLCHHHRHLEVLTLMIRSRWSAPVSYHHLRHAVQMLMRQSLVNAIAFHLHHHLEFRTSTLQSHVCAAAVLSNGKNLGAPPSRAFLSVLERVTVIEKPGGMARSDEEVSNATGRLKAVAVRHSLGRRR